MRFTLATVGLALVGLAAAQSSTTNDASSTTTSLSPTQTCLNACAAGDVNCQAKCLGLPYPDGAQTNATTSCEAGCPQGNGTEAETQAYASCLNACVSSYYYASGTGTIVSVVSTQGLVNGTTSIVAAGSPTGGSGSSGSAGASASNGSNGSSGATTTGSSACKSSLSLGLY